MTFPRPEERATVSVEEAARLLGISRGSAYEAARTGALPALHLGRRYLVPTARLAAMVGIEFGVARVEPDVDDHAPVA